MAIGTSSGAYYDTDFHHEAGINTDPSVDNNVVTPKETPTDDIVAPPGKVELDKATKPSLTPVADTRLYVSPNKDPDYDMEGWKEANPDVRVSPGQHYPDTYKLPNHITFSDESKYSNDETPGGQWQKDDKGSWTFTPSAYNLLRHGPSELKEYFQNQEPDSKLNLDTAHGIAAEASEKAADALKRAKGTPPTIDEDTGLRGPILHSIQVGDKRYAITADDRDTAISTAMAVSGGGLNTRGPVTSMEDAVSRVRNQPSNIGPDVPPSYERRFGMTPEQAANNYHALPSGENVSFAHHYEEHAAPHEWEAYERMVNDPLRQTPFDFRSAQEITEASPHYPAGGRETPLDIHQRPDNNFYNTQGMSASEAAQHYHSLRENIPAADEFLDRFERHASRNELDVFDRHLDHLRDPDGLQAEYERESYDTMQERWDREDAEHYKSTKEEIEKGKTLQEKGGMKLKERPKDPYDPSNYHELGFMNEEGLVGKLTVEERERGKLLYVDIAKGLKPSRSLGGPNDPNVNNFGTKQIKQLAKLLKEQFPEAEEIAGFRVSGARLKWGGNANARMRIRPAKEGPQRKGIDQLNQEWD